MKNNLPKYSLYLLLVSLGLSIFTGMISGDGAFFIMGVFITGFYISPVVFLALLIHKLFTRSVKNMYFYPTLAIAAILILIVLYLASHTF